MVRHSEAWNDINCASNWANEWLFNSDKLHFFPVEGDESGTTWVVIISGSYLITILHLNINVATGLNFILQRAHFILLIQSWAISPQDRPLKGLIAFLGIIKVYLFWFPCWRLICWLAQLTCITHNIVTDWECFHSDSDNINS